MPLQSIIGHLLTCSRPGCIIDRSGPDAGEIVREARAEGWSVSWDNSPDLCPTHAPVGDGDPRQPRTSVMVENLNGEIVPVRAGADLYLVTESQKQIPGFVFEWAYLDEESTVQLVVLDQHKRRMRWPVEAMLAVVPHE